MRIVALARARGLRLTVQDVFRHSTIAELAQHAVVGATPEAISTQRWAGLSEDDIARLPADVEDAYPLSILQAGMVFHSTLSTSGTMYHDIFSYRLVIPFDASALESALRRVIARHPVLRTSFAFEGYGQAVQLVHAEVAAPLELVDVRSAPDPRSSRSSGGSARRSIARSSGRGPRSFG